MRTSKPTKLLPINLLRYIVLVKTAKGVQRGLVTVLMSKAIEWAVTFLDTINPESNLLNIAAKFLA